jgi:hypothetical protein
MVAHLWEVDENKVKTHISVADYNKPIVGANLQAIYIDNREYNDKTIDIIKKEVG